MKGTWTSVRDLFARVAESAPDAIAVEQEGAHLSHRALAGRSGGLTRRLLSEEMGDEAVVAVAVTRSADWITALLGVLGAGAVYFPIDRRTPALKLARIVEEAEPRAWVVDRAGREGLEAVTARAGQAGAPKVIELSTCWEDGDPPEVAVGKDDPCYLFYTSGSTGRPKGILGRAKAIDHFVRWEIEILGLGAETRGSQLVAPTFDAFLRDALVPLCAGGTVRAPSAEILHDTRRLIRWLDDRRITLVHTVPSLLRSLLSERLEADDLGALRHVLLSGESLLPSDVRSWCDVFGARVQLVNLYGPSETTMTKLFYFVAPEDGERRSIPIGKPMPGARVLVVERRGKPCPPGATGEILIRTPYRSLGYFRQPALTERVFVVNPFNDDPRDLIYKTGDLGRLLGDGNLEFAGRVDRQVKVRGVRVELDEVERRLAEHPSVREVAAVFPRECDRASLVAYVGADDALAVEDLRAFAGERLDPAEVPSVIVLLKALPKTASGKVDRRALPDPASGRTSNGEDRGVASPSEEIVATLFAEVLGRVRVGPRDDFFQLGGHSLLAMQVASRVREAFGIELPLPEIFERPRVSELSERIDGLAAETAGRRLPDLISREPRDREPLSFAQERLWFAHRLEPESGLYNIVQVLEIEGPLAPRALAGALDDSTARHEVLRTVFDDGDGRPFQRVLPHRPHGLPVADLSGLPAARAARERRRLAAFEGARPFALAQAPPLRTLLVRNGAASHALVLAVHHIAADAWSMAILLGELAHLYRERTVGGVTPLPELPIRYADHAAWQRRVLAEGGLEAEVDFWRRRLAGAPRVLELPTDRPRPAVPGHQGSELPLRFDLERLAGLRAVARDASATLFMVLSATFAILLQRLTGQDDLCVGTPVAGRTHVETEGLVGLFVNSLVLRCQVDGAAPFDEFLARVRRDGLEAHARQLAPFDLLVDRLAPERDLAHAPLFQVMVALQNIPRPLPSVPGLTLALGGAPAARTKFDVTVVLEESESGLSGRWEYDAELFDATTARRWAGYLERLLAAVAEDPTRPVDGLPMMSRSESHQARIEWGHPPGQPLSSESIARRLVRRARKHPESIALVFGGTHLSYGDLSARSARQAERLRRSGVGQGDLVGVCLDRSVDLVVSLLGVLAAGAAYVPLDPTNPPERLASMLEDAGVCVLLTQTELEPRLPAGPWWVERADDRRGSVGPDLLSEEGPATAPPGLAYVTYTSGSTGRPKGVAVDHRAIARLVLDTDYVHLDERDRTAFASNTSFDAATFELWGPLLTGGCVVGVSRETLLAPAELARQLRRQRVTRLFLTTALVHHFAREEPDAFAILRTLLFGGEAVDVASVRSLLAGAPPKRLLHVYGPTESTTFASWHPVASVPAEAATVPIGGPLAHTILSVVDACSRTAPLGVAGELRIGGAGLSFGYWGRGGATAGAFVPDDRAREPGSRLYRTGDLVRWNGRGALEFVGRIDHQVKVRGFRIELGEVRSALVSHPGLRDAAVIVHEDGPGERRLVAYTVAASETSPDPAEIREHLEERLPGYMIPGVVIPVDGIPLNPNGKVDRRALPAPESAYPEAGRPGVAPRGPIEAALAEVWREVLRIEALGVHDNYFEFGGDSILSIQIASRAKRRGLHVTPRDLFLHQTVAELAAVAGRSRSVENQAAVVGPVPLTPIQHWFFEQELADPHHFNQAVMVGVARDARAAWLAAAVDHLVDHHDALRLGFEYRDGSWRQWSAPPGRLGLLAVVDLGGLGEIDRRRAIETAAAQVQPSFDLARPPLVRVVCFDRGAGEEGRLLLAVHHLVVDGVSWRILLEDLETAYGQIRRGAPVILPPKTTSFERWASTLLERTEAGEFDPELSVWAAPERRSLPPLPTDFGTGPNLRGEEEKVHVSLDQEATRSLLRQLPRRFGVEMGDALLAAVAESFRDWTGRDSFLVDLELHGREDDLVEGLDLSHTVGWFTAVVPVLLGLGGTAGVESLRAVRRQLSAIPRNGIGHSALRHLRNGDAGGALATLPRPEVSFNYLGQVDSALAGSSLFLRASESIGAAHSPRGRRPHLLEINASVTEDRLRVNWSYHPGIHDASTVRALGDRFLAALRGYLEGAGIDHAPPRRYDVTGAGLSDQELDSVLDQLTSGDST